MPNLKTFGIHAWVPLDWPVPNAPNGNRQRFVVVAAPSRAAALRAFAEVGIEVTAHHFRLYGSNPGGDAEIALQRPGVVFYQPKNFAGLYEPAPHGKTN